MDLQRSSKIIQKVTEAKNRSKAAPDPQSYSFLSSWSPNSQSITYPVFYDDKTEYFIARLDGGDPQRIDTLPNVALAEPSWTVQSYILWYGYDKNKMGGDSASADSSEIYVVNVITRKELK